MILLKVSGISKKESGNYTVKDINFVQNSRQKIAIAGETGSGKTTLLKMIAGLVQPDAGETLLYGQRVLGPFEKLLPGHLAIAYHSQHFELRNNYTVEEELESKNKLPEDEANSIYEVCRISHLLKRKTNELSGGEKQRIFLARLLITYPSLLLLDEPFSNLDMIHKSIIRQVINDISEKLSITCMLVSHDPMDILPWADTVLVMQNGEIIQQGTAEHIYRQPVNEYCAGLFGEYNMVNTSSSNVFADLPWVSKNGKQLLTRPEDFAITNKTNSNLQGIVEKCLFLGSNYLLDIKIDTQLVRAITNKNQFKPGDPIYLSLSADNAWYL
jgi:ABC-type sugar transport system ATPase subunit